MSETDPQHSLSLVWDSSRCRIYCYGIEIRIAPAQFPPIKPDAVVEEQDTGLLMGEQYLTEPVSEPAEPAWFLANRLEHTPEQVPGSVLLVNGRPRRLLAIVHDVNQSPTWREEWIRQALQQVMDITQMNGFRSLGLPMLGARFGQYTAGAFLRLLSECLTELKNSHLQQIWLISRDGESCEELLSFLQCPVA